MTVDIEQTLADVAASWGAPAPWTGARVAVTARDMSAADVAALLSDAPGHADGWVCTADRVLALKAGHWTEPAPKRSARPAWDTLANGVLSAELAWGPGHSVHLRRHGATLVRHDLREGEGDEVLVRPASFASTERGDPTLARLVYRTFWRREARDEAPGIALWRPWAARFVGWEE